MAPEHRPEPLPSTHRSVDTEGAGHALCARCQQPLRQPSAVGGCVLCMSGFVWSVDEAEDLVEPLLSYGHYQILRDEDGGLRELGRGAMGTTYRARDAMLHTEVALKIIGGRVADDSAARTRFLSEARAAARLHHPNVARVFHYGEQDGECFYAMELVEGETLEAHVRRDGPLPVAAALEVGVQVARALVTAEAQGLVHRDLKPSNLMLVPGEAVEGGKPLVKVIDFGLAEAVSATGDQQASRAFAGTPAFASPEQFSTGGHPVDTRADIYALGVSLWYSLSGQVPFAGRTLEAIHKEQLAGEPPTSQLTACKVPGPVVRLLCTMLATDPERRPPSARALLEALRRCQRRLAATRRFRRGSLWMAGLAGALALTVGAARFTGPADAPLGEGASASPTVAVLPFENLSPDPVEAYFAHGVQQELTTDLARIKQLKVVTPGNDYPSSPGRRDLVQLGRELAVSQFIEGSVRRGNGRLAIQVKLVSVSDPAHPWTKPYEGRLADVFSIQRDIAREVAARLQATLSPQEKAKLRELPSSDPVAFDLYLRAQQGRGDFTSHAEMRRAYLGKLALVEEAVERDPGFADAYCLLAGLHDSLYMHRAGAPAEELAVDHRALAESALETARRLQPDSGDVHLAIARHFYMACGDNEQARAELEIARRTACDRSELVRATAMISRAQGRWEESAQAFEEAATLNPRATQTLFWLAEVYRAMRRYADADRTIGRAIALLPAGLSTRHQLFRAMGSVEQSADLAPLEDLLASTRSDNPDLVAQLQLHRLIAALCRHDPAAVERALVTLPPGPVSRGELFYPGAWFEALAARMRGDEPAARQAFLSARTEVSEAVRADGTDARSLSLLAMIDAGLGRTEDACREGRRAGELMPLAKSATAAPVIACNLAVVYAWTDQPDLALALLEQWSGRGAGINLLDQPSYGDLCLNPVWDPLRQNPRFSALVKQLAPAVPGRDLRR